MKKVKGKKLSLEKLNITKLDHMLSIKGGHIRSDDAGSACKCTDDVIYFKKTKVTNCETGGTTIIQLG